MLSGLVNKLNNYVSALVINVYLVVNNGIIRAMVSTYTKSFVTA